MLVLLAALLCAVPPDAGEEPSLTDAGAPPFAVETTPPPVHAPRVEEGAVDVGEGEATEALSLLDLDGGLPPDGGPLYTADLDDAELERLWQEDRAALGSISLGLAEAGRLLNGVRLEPGPEWTLVSPAAAWGTQETVDDLRTVARAVREAVPTAVPLRINDLGRAGGGPLRPHQTHQSGRDVDLGFYYPSGVHPGAVKKKREDAMDLPANWALVKALVTLTDVQVVLVDRRVQAALYRYALKVGEDREWLDSLFHAGPDSLFQHARRHRDHFHVRFYAPRSQELGRRLQPLLAASKDQNVALHRVVRGDTLGRLAQRYGSSAAQIRKANRLTTNALSVGRVLSIPLRAACTSCPLPPPLVVPPRRLPPPSQPPSPEG